MKFPLFIAKRYLFSKSSNNAINIITLISALSIIAGSAALFVVLSGFSGLKDFSLSFASVFDPDLKINAAKGKTFELDSLTETQLKNLPGIASYSKIIEERAFLEYKGKNHIAYIKGVDAQYPLVNPVDSTLIYKSWISQEEPVAVIGFGISRLLSLGVNNYNDLLQIMVPRPGTGQVTDPNQAFKSSRVVVIDIFQVNEELDQKYVFTGIEFARNLLDYDAKTICAIEIKKTEGTDTKQLKSDLESLFGDSVIVKTRAQLNDKLYKMLNTENLAVYLIFTLVLIVALFNLIGSIIMIILDKKPNVQTLHSLGAPLSEIRKIFFYQGAMMTVFGGLLGVLIGVLIVGGQILFNWVMITANLPYPMKFTVWNFVSVLLTICVLGILASLLASSRIKPDLVKE